MFLAFVGGWVWGMLAVKSEIGINRICE